MAQFAATARSEALWKPLNHAVLLKSRDENEHVRLGAVLVLHAFYKKLGDEFLGINITFNITNPLAHYHCVTITLLYYGITIVLFIFYLFFSVPGNEYFFYVGSNDRFVHTFRTITLLHTYTDIEIIVLSSHPLIHLRPSFPFDPHFPSTLIPLRPSFPFDPHSPSTLIPLRPFDPSTHLGLISNFSLLRLDLGLLPETVTFLAELLEDDSGAVERETHSLIATIEQYLGESLKNYF